MNKEMATTLTQLGKSDAQHVHLYRFVWGVLYALEEYERLATIAPKQTQSDQSYSDEFKHLQKAFQDSVAPPPSWLRGFFYNAAVMRLDAAWERSLRVILNKTTMKGNLEELYKCLRTKEPTLPEYEQAICKQVRAEVGFLKHQDTGPSEDMRERPEVVRDGLKQLVDLLHRKRLLEQGK